MKNKIYSFALIVSAVGLTACTDNYGNINRNPYEATDLSRDGYALGSAMNNLAGCVISSDVNTTQFTECLLGGPMGGYFADSNAGFTETISNYNPKNDWTRVFLKSDHIIPTLYNNLADAKQISQATNDPVPYAIALVMKVATMHRVTDTYGPIPYTDLDKGKLSVAYDSQEKVYDAFFTELDEAIAVLKEHTADTFVPTADYVYKGNVGKWLKLANSLKLRLALRIAYANPTKAQQMAEAAVAAANGGVIESNDDNANWDYFKGGKNDNPLYVATRYNQATGSSTGGDTHVAADIICYMNGYKDARREKYFVKSEWTGVDYVGMRRGIVIPSLEPNGRKYSGVNIMSTSPLCWMNAAEVAFLRAEGIAVFNFNLGGTAETFYNEGIKLSFAQWGASGADAYINDNSSVPATYDDPAGTYSSADPMSTITIKWDEQATVEEKQERIIIQKWIANWMLGNEAWADIRRTGYPKLMPVVVNKSGGEVDSNKGARRMRYPQEEFSSNSVNVEYAIRNYLNGPNTMATDVWWAAKK